MLTITFFHDLTNLDRCAFLALEELIKGPSIHPTIFMTDYPQQGGWILSQQGSGRSPSQSARINRKQTIARQIRLFTPSLSPAFSPLGRKPFYPTGPTQTQGNHADSSQVWIGTHNLHAWDDSAHHSTSGSFPRLIRSHHRLPSGFGHGSCPSSPPPGISTAAQSWRIPDFRWKKHRLST